MTRFSKTRCPLSSLEACGCLHKYGRLPRAFGHEVRSNPLQYIKPYVGHGKPQRMLKLCEAVRFYKIEGALAACMLMTM